MQTREIFGFLGSIAVICFGIAIANYFVKYIHKKYITKLGKDKKEIVVLYRKIMKIIIKNHKLAGTIAIFAVLAHFSIAFSISRISITGLIAALFMLTIFFLGVYGAFINKSHKGMWLKVHRGMAFALLVAIVIHLI
ncbi:hypothetical protein LGK95_04595 [Clostridium algoriphilum]|uniref:hypothetical protein n=1 Tax=Clostridium algoriphilum TaxID=198347 RepID=UPI001CF123CB|nr:hypothetical protein [Clostridium algoriphilum]MCB2292815.1 hypothetical protein [Clostridium algoriphilum]